LLVGNTTRLQTHFILEEAELTVISSRGNQLDLSTWMAMPLLFGTPPNHSCLDVVKIIFLKT